MSDWYQDVMDFHKKFEMYVGQKPSWPSDSETDMRWSLIDEECDELFDALEFEDLVAAADALADLIYVAIGFSIALGIDLRPIWTEVHLSNMRKVGGGKRGDGKILKPDGWIPPDIDGAIARQMA